MSYYLHSVPGRLRVKVPQLRNNAQRCQKVQDLLMALAGVQDVEVNCLTGSVLVCYDDEVLNDTSIILFLEEENLFDMSLAKDASQHIKKMSVSAGETVGRFVFSWALGKALQRGGFSLLAAII